MEPYGGQWTRAPCRITPVGDHLPTCDLCPEWACSGCGRGGPMAWFSPLDTSRFSEGVRCPCCEVIARAWGQPGDSRATLTRHIRTQAAAAFCHALEPTLTHPLSTFALFPCKSHSTRLSHLTGEPWGLQLRFDRELSDPRTKDPALVWTLCSCWGAGFWSRPPL